MRKRTVVRVAGTILASLVFGLGACQKKEAPAPPPAPRVKAAAVLTRDVPVYVEAIGQTRGNTEIEIRARVEGFIETIDFAEGTPVQKGQLLYTLDSRPFEASLASAKANLAQAEAELQRAHQDVVRFEPLVAKNAISRQEYETAVSIERAQVSAVEAARSAVVSAEIDVSYTRITAPDAGLVGKTEVYPGTLVGRGQSTLLTRISKIDPIHVRFTIAERDYLVYARSRTGEEPRPGGGPALELMLADGSTHPHPGSFVFVDRTVDPQTGTILLEAAFPNPEKIVRPGQYARVRAAVNVKPGAILVPQRAVRELQGTHNVAVVGADGTIEIRNVQAGGRVGSLWVIDSGLAAGEKIVVEGLQKVRAGVKVEAEMVTIEDDPAVAS